MNSTPIDFREPIQHPAEGALEYTGHEALAEQYRAALAGPKPAQEKPDA